MKAKDTKSTTPAKAAVKVRDIQPKKDPKGGRSGNDDLIP